MAILAKLHWGLLTPLSILKLVISAPLGLLVFYLLYNELVRYRSRIKNLPGPQGWPIVGNLFQVGFRLMVRETSC
jgi:3-hydroxyphenylacetate 6-hydroxylase